MSIADRRKAVVAAIETVTSKYGGEVAQCGVKTELDDKRAVDVGTGFWKNVGYVTSKPPRWLVHLAVENGGVVARLPPFGEASRLCHHNMGSAGRQLLGSLTRVVPVIRLASGRYRIYEEWEWALLFFFPRALTGGGAAEPIVFHPWDGRVICMGKDQRYIDAALVGLVRADSTFGPASDLGGYELTYGAASAALRNFIKVNLPNPMAGEATGEAASA